MDKKTVISDFRSLKGKFILSENERPDTQEKTTVKESQKPEETQLQVGQQLQFQMETFRKVIRQNLHHRGMRICFIHGIGDGILKAAIRKELDEVLALRCSYSVGDPAVTIVYIK